MTISLGGPLLLAGAGRMGSALLKAWLDHGLDPDLIYIQDPAPSPEVAALIENFALNVGTPPEMPEPPAVLLLAVKPQIMDEVLPGLAALSGPDTLVLSIAAGRTIAGIARHFPPGQPIIRSMPNTPAAICRGMTVATSNDYVTPAQAERAIILLSAVGDVAWVEDEAQIDAVTAVSGSGPAYVFLLAECLAEAGVKLGLAPELAERLAERTIYGAGELMQVSPESAARLREAVTSAGGTTAAALDILMSEKGLCDLMTRAVTAAAERSRALSE